ncbi:protein FAM47E-like [Lates japonicus]|uniref:Protein FAM47E-like protein n=1 Tax=Lates japonicus TaxID=270547 RepID=A0AAD3R444_LATJO|nr:protein FAM47E-like protein [Lates japonicus]
MEAKNTRPTFPWYKERLQTKYLKASTNKISLVSSRWHFVNVNLDDCSSVLSGAQSGISPMIQKQMRREYVAVVEEKLKRHPLAMYPHYKDHMTPELFNKVVSVLDPDLCVNSASSLPTPTADHAGEEGEEDYTEPSKGDVNRAKQGASANTISTDVQNPSPRNPYILQMNRNGIKKCQKVKANQLSNREDTKAATKLFSRWFVSPDEELSVTESAIRGTFSQ